MFLSCKIKAIPIIEKKNKQKTTKNKNEILNSEEGLTGCRVGLWKQKKGELAFITTIKKKSCQGVAVNVNCLFIKK